MKQYTIRTTGRSALGLLQITGGILLLGTGLIRLLTMGIWSRFAGEIPVFVWIVPAVISVITVWVFYLGIMNFTTIKRGKNLVSLLAAHNEAVLLSQASAQLSRSRAGLLRDLSRMKRQKYFRDICVLEDCIVLEGVGWDRALMIGADATKGFMERERAVFRGQAICEVRTKVAPQAAEQADAEPDLMRELIGTGACILKTIRHQQSGIDNAQIKAHVDDIVAAAEQMLDFAEGKPEKYAAVRPSVEYYLPTISDLLSEYQELEDQAIKGNNIVTSMDKIEKSMCMAAENIRMELDGLYLEKMIDITVDVEVMEHVMKEKGSLSWKR